MKYALVNSTRRRVRRVSASLPEAPDGFEIVEITDEQADLVDPPDIPAVPPDGEGNGGSPAIPVEPLDDYFLIDGVLVPATEHRANLRAIREAEEITEAVTAAKDDAGIRAIVNLFNERFPLKEITPIQLRQEIRRIITS